MLSLSNLSANLLSSMTSVDISVKHHHSRKQYVWDHVSLVYNMLLPQYLSSVSVFSSKDCRPDCVTIASQWLWRYAMGLLRYMSNFFCSGFSFSVNGKQCTMWASDVTTLKGKEQTYLLHTRDWRTGPTKKLFPPSLLLEGAVKCITIEYLWQLKWKQGWEWGSKVNNEFFKGGHQEEHTS